jgi:hypothetical protein
MPRLRMIRLVRLQTAGRDRFRPRQGETEIRHAPGFLLRLRSQFASLDSSRGWYNVYVRGIAIKAIRASPVHDTCVRRLDHDRFGCFRSTASIGNMRANGDMGRFRSSHST